MELFFDILKITIPAVIIFLTVYFILDKYFKNEEKRRIIELKFKMNKKTIPLKIQAHERMTLFLERINPKELAMRTQAKGKLVISQHVEMIRIIKNEFEHNLTQQLYITNSTWKMIEHSKEEVIRLLNIAANKCKEKTSLEFTHMIIEIYSKVDDFPTDIVKNRLKKDFHSIIF